MNEGFIFVRQLTRPIRETVKDIFYTRSIFFGSLAINNKIISKKKMRNRRAGPRDFDYFKVVKLFFFSYVSREDFNVEDKKKGRHRIILSDTSRGL